MKKARDAGLFHGGAGGIRTLDRALQPYNGLANRRLQPLGHSSIAADMPDAGPSRKRQIQITLRSFGGAAAGLAFSASSPDPGCRAILLVRKDALTAHRRTRRRTWLCRGEGRWREFDSDVASRPDSNSAGLRFPIAACGRSGSGPTSIPGTSASVGFTRFRP